MRRTRLAKATLTAIAISVPAAGAAAGVGAGTAHAAVASASQQKAVTVRAQQAKAAARTESFDMRAANYVKGLEGIRYRYGGSTRAGFDCSGLTQYVYRHFGKAIARTANSQFREFRRISKARAWGGDLVFFHDSSNPNSYVYHVGIYEGGHDMVAATTTGGHVEWQSFAWAGNTVTFGTITH
ncbi:MAG TPA: C40 family peptidase [Trebonia sp.]|jgi:cell wall-associated NlpC family hydrolase|nr:C40 family peptidase [Trebonia sp.]